MTRLIIAGACAAFALSGFAAEAPSNQSDVFAKHWKTAAEYTLAVADQMPADAYSFKPVPEEMSFAEQLVHVAQSNAFFFSTLSGEKFTETKPTALDKATVMKYVRDSFDWTNAEFAKINSAQIQNSYKMEGTQMSGHEVLMLAWNHTTHHRGQLIVYLRLKHITPTDYKF